jgi:glycosyltransferase involved in cell wall biosynthesis
MAKKISDICIVIPAYNEAGQIGHTLNDIFTGLKKSKLSADIVVVDDGSKDNTAAIVAKTDAYLIQHVLNSGAGGATATGLSYAQQKGYTIAATMDADGQHLPEDVVACIKSLQETGSDLLIGSRLIDTRGMSRVKILGNKGLSVITYVLFGINVTDSQSGLRVFSKQSLDKLRWKTSGYEFCSEMLWRAKQQHLTIREYPIKAVYTEYSMSKGQNNWNAINIIKSLLKRRILELLG